MDTIKIEKNVEVPKIRETYPFDKMAVKDAIFTKRNVASTAYSWSQNNHNGKRKFITRAAEKFFDKKTGKELNQEEVEQIGKKNVRVEKGFYLWRIE